MNRPQINKKLQILHKILEKETQTYIRTHINKYNATQSPLCNIFTPHVSHIYLFIQLSYVHPLKHLFR